MLEKERELRQYAMIKHLAQKLPLDILIENIMKTSPANNQSSQKEEQKTSPMLAALIKAANLMEAKEHKNESDQFTEQSTGIISNISGNSAENHIEISPKSYKDENLPDHKISIKLS